VPCTYHKGAKHTLRTCRLYKKLVQERFHYDPEPQDLPGFQKARVRLTPNTLGGTDRQVLFVSENEPPRDGATDSQEAARVRANADKARRREEEQRRNITARDLMAEFDAAGIRTFNSPQANLGAAIAQLQRAGPNPEIEAVIANLRVANALVEEKSAASKSASSSGSKHSRSRSNQPRAPRNPALEPILEEVNQNAPRDLRENIETNRRQRDVRQDLNQRHRERDEAELRRRLKYDQAYGRPSAHRSVEREDRARHQEELDRRAAYEQQYGDPVNHVTPENNPPPRPQVVITPATGSAGDAGGIVPFPALADRFRSVKYPTGFKPKINKYDGRSDPNIWLQKYTVAVNAVGGTYDHMAAYFPLVMDEAPLLWLNNLDPGSINSWADLSREFTTNFQASRRPTITLETSSSSPRSSCSRARSCGPTPTATSPTATPASTSGTTR
jgi:hypothetical protein